MPRYRNNYEEKDVIELFAVVSLDKKDAKIMYLSSDQVPCEVFIEDHPHHKLAMFKVLAKFMCLTPIAR